MDNVAAQRWAKIGSFFQIPMLFFFVASLFASVWYGMDAPVKHILWHLPGHVGFLMFAWCLYYLYVKKRRTTQLITTGLFRYTRHPMYIGLFLMNLSDVWLPWPDSVPAVLILLQIGFVINMLLAGFFQEQETLARFGKEAEAYYDRTYRLPWFPKREEGIA